MIILYDWRNASHCHIHHHTSLEAAELQAVRLMDEMKHLLPAKAWQRGEYMNQDYMEYCERGQAIGAARVYVRIILNGVPQHCDKCDVLATHEVRAGAFCETHYTAYYLGTCE